LLEGAPDDFTSVSSNCLIINTLFKLRLLSGFAGDREQGGSIGR